MGILTNPKHEKFAQGLAQGLTAADAYEQAGYPRHEGNASRLRSSEKIQSRIQELLTAGAEKAGVTIQRIVDELAKIGFANMADYMAFPEAGDPYLDWTKLTRDQAAAISEVTVEDYVDGRGEDGREVKRVKFKLSDKQAALEKLGKHLGMFKEKVEHDGQIIIRVGNEFSGV